MTVCSNAGDNTPPAAAAAIIGPTASGKSALAVTVAARLNAEIISVDAGAVYRGMNIGTATPDAALQQKIPHHLINITAPDNPYNVARFYHDAAAAAAAIRARGKLPLFVGGSMMYFNILFCGLARLPAETDEPPYPPLPLLPALLLPADRAHLRRRIAERLADMWAAGLLEETRQLLADWSLAAESSPLRLAGYRQAIHHLNGDYDAALMRQKAYTATSQLAKRQFTWLHRWRTRHPVIDPLAEGTDATADTLTTLFQPLCR